MIMTFLWGFLAGLAVSLITTVILLLQYRAFAGALALLLKEAIDALVNALSSEESGGENGH